MRTRPATRLGLGLLILVMAACGGQVATTTTPPASTATGLPSSTPPWPTNGWTTSTPEEQGMDSELLADLIDHIVSTGLSVDSVTVVRHGYLVLDATFYPFPADTRHSVYSVTKSVIGTLIGIAIDHGLIPDVSTGALDLLPDDAPADADSRKVAMTVEDLLTMSTGLDCRDSYLYAWEGLGEMRASDDWPAHVLALPMRDEPGTRFEYCNGSSHLLSAILTETTGMPASAFADETLFGSLGITDYSWNTAPGGENTGYSELRLLPRDMAKLGYLYLRNGDWNGDQLLSPEWVEAATSVQIHAGTLAEDYGYHWWVPDATYAMALGFGGQYVIVVPGADLVAVFTSGLGDQFAAPNDLLHRYLPSAVVADDPIPSNAAGVARLLDLVGLAAAVPDPVSLEARDATDIDGVTYTLAQNSGGFEWFRLDFDGNAITMALEDVDRPIEVTMALDGRFHVGEAWGSQWAFRPEWTGDDTLTIEFKVIGVAGRGHFEFRFDDDQVRFEYLERVEGTRVRAMATR